MARFSRAAYRPLAAKQSQPEMDRHDIVCLHTMVGSLAGTDRYFKANGWGGTESHFGVGGIWGEDLDGVIYQWQDTQFTADANYQGNHRVISIETADNAPSRPSEIKPWTPKQIDSIVAITVWACRLYDIPAVLVPDSKPGRRGIAYHRQGCQHSQGVGAVPGFLVAGGERWTTSLGKECPGAARIKQVPGIVARVEAELKAGAKPAPAKPAEETELSFKTEHTLTKADVEAYGQQGLIAGKTEKSFGEIVRFPPATARLRREAAALLGALSTAVQGVKADTAKIWGKQTADRLLADQDTAALKAKFDELAGRMDRQNEISNQQALLLTDLIALLKTPKEGQ